MIPYRNPQKCKREMVVRNIKATELMLKRKRGDIMVDYRKIRQLRRMMDLSQKEFAVRIGYSSQNSLHKLERGMIDLPASRLEKIARVLHVSVEELLIPDKPEINPSTNTKK